VSGNAFQLGYTTPVGASDNSRVAQRFSQLLTTTTCVSACWVTQLEKSVKVHVNQIINTAQGQLLFYAVQVYW